MKKLLLILLFPTLLQAATSYTEFYVVPSTGANTNSGSTSGSAAYSSVNGNWNGSTIFTPTDGSTPSSTVSVGDFASVYLDGASVSVYVARVTAVGAGVNGTITVSSAVKAGTAPASGATGRSITVGGAWAGPSGTVGFPFDFVEAALKSVTGSYTPRINFKNGTTYSVTAAITHGDAGPIKFQGYTTNPGDGGRAIIDGGATGTSFTILTVTGANCDIEDFIFQNNGDSGSAAHGLVVSGAEVSIRRCVFHDLWGSGLSITSANGTVIECEAYACNGSNTAATGGFNSATAISTFVRCISHDNSTANASGYVVGFGSNFFHCISESNTAKGWLVSAAQTTTMIGCDAYNNGSDGIDYSGTATGILLESCNFVKNGTSGTGYGINSSANPASRNGFIVKCGFGAGTQANDDGDILTTLLGVSVLDSVSYSADAVPWVDPANGDFRITLSTAKSAGRGTFTQTASSYTGTIGYPDIGAAQHADTPASSGGSYTWAQ